MTPQKTGCVEFLHMAKDIFPSKIILRSFVMVTVKGIKMVSLGAETGLEKLT